MSRKKELMKNTLIIFFGKACTYLISFLLLPLYTSYLQPSDYGLVELITTYVTLLVPIITMDLEMSIFRFLVESRGKEKNTKTLINNNFYMLGICLTLFSTLYLIVTCFVNVPFRFLILIDIIVCVLSENFLQVARGFGKTLVYSISCILTGLTTIVMNIILISVFHMGAEGMITSMALANFVCSIYIYLKLDLKSYFDYKSVDKKIIKEMYKYSIPLIPNGISWWIVNVSDRSIISFVLGDGANGIYGISNKFSTIISSLTGVFNISWSESAALHINSEDRDEFFTDIMNTAFKVFAAIGVLMLALMPFVFPILINVKFNEAYQYIPFLVLGVVFNVGLCLYNQVYLAKKLSKQVASTAMAGAAINIIINVLLIKRIGLYAAALSTTISYFVMMIYRHFDVKKYVKIKIEKPFIIESILIYTLAIYLYYQNNFFGNILNLVIVSIYSVYINSNFIKSTYRTIMNKIPRKRKV